MTMNFCIQQNINPLTDEHQGGEACSVDDLKAPTKFH
jgi:hypothetical protein